MKTHKLALNFISGVKSRNSESSLLFLFILRLYKVADVMKCLLNLWNSVLKPESWSRSRFFSIAPVRSWSPFYFMAPFKIVIQTVKNKIFLTHKPQCLQLASNK